MFSPTALLVMTHNKTGLKYFCKTSKLNNICNYKGSGVHWKYHLRAHGKDVTVGVLGIYYDEQRCVEAAKNFSLINDIVNSDQWANLILENGLDGAPIGENHPNYGKPSPCIGQKRPHAGKCGPDNLRYGKPSPMQGKKNIGASEKLKDRPRPKGAGKSPKSVICVTTGQEFSSVAEAAKFYNGRSGSICRCCKGVSKTAYGMQWAYK